MPARHANQEVLPQRTLRGIQRWECMEENDDLRIAFCTNVTAIPSVILSDPPCPLW